MTDGFAIEVNVPGSFSTLEADAAFDETSDVDYREVAVANLGLRSVASAVDDAQFWISGIGRNHTGQLLPQVAVYAWVKDAEGRIVDGISKSLFEVDERGGFVILSGTASRNPALLVTERAGVYAVGRLTLFG